MRIRMLTGAATAMLLLAPAHAAETAAPATIGKWGVDIAGISKAIRPGDDFYGHVNNAWMKQARIPAGLPSIDAPTEVFLSTEQRIAGILEQTQNGTHPAGSPRQHIADFYRSHADMTRRNALGITPIKDIMGTIDAADSHDDIARIMAYPWMDAMIGGGVVPDADNPRRQIGIVGAGGLTLPSRDYYLDQAPAYAAFRKAFVDYVAATYRRAGIADADARAAKVLALETEIAKRQWTKAQMRDVVRMNHVMTPAELKAYAPGFPWNDYLAALGLDKETRLKVAMDTALRDNARLFAATPVADLQSWLVFKTLDTWATSLSQDWVQAHFDFHQKTLMDVASRRSAELETVAVVNKTLGEEIGRIYVDQYFGADDRAKVDEMVGYLRATYRDRISKNGWMDDATRAEAITKLDKITSHIGFPERWHDRSTVRIAADDLVGNQTRLMAWQMEDSLKKLAEGTRDWEFPYPAQEVNAGYLASANSINFPAGILQPPFFDPKADPAVNFGSIAAVIGHEIGHGFDDQGSRSDGDGKIRDWWTPASRAEFERRTSSLVDQFNQYEPVPGVKINGRQNLGENIGDLGGLSVAYAAYRRYVDEKQGGKAPIIDGYSGDQRFFLSWAQLWRELASDAEQRRRVLTDPHSAGKFRVNGIVRNMDAWYDAFAIKPTDALYLPPAERVKIW